MGGLQQTFVKGTQGEEQMQLGPEEVIFTGLELFLDPGGQNQGKAEAAALECLVYRVPLDFRPGGASGVRAGPGQGCAIMFIRRSDFSVCALGRLQNPRIWRTGSPRLIQSAHYRK